MVLARLKPCPFDLFVVSGLGPEGGLRGVLSQMLRNFLSQMLGNVANMLHGGFSMTDTVICVRCHGSFERVHVEVEEVEDRSSGARKIEETEPVCEECEHEFLAWTCCPPIV